MTAHARSPLARRAIELIGQRRSARSDWLCEALGVARRKLDAALRRHVVDGTLVACQITAPGRRTQYEYRLGLAGAGHMIANVPAAHDGPAQVFLAPVCEDDARLPGLLMHQAH